MKLFRFIRNLWKGFLGLFGGKDFKDFLKEIGFYLIAFIITMSGLYGFGWLARWMNLTWIVSPDKRDDTMLLGAMFAGALFFFLIVGLFVWLSFIELKRIWNES